MDARRRFDAPAPRPRVARTPRHLRVVRGGAGAQGRAPLDLRAALASLVVPGLGQLLQGRRRAAGANAPVAAALGALWLARAVPHAALVALLAAWVLGSVIDAARHRSRPPLRRA